MLLFSPSGFTWTVSQKRSSTQTGILHSNIISLWFIDCFEKMDDSHYGPWSGYYPHGQSDLVVSSVLHSLVCPSESVCVSVVKHPSCVLCVNGVSSETSHWPSPAPWWLWRSCTCSPTWPTTPWWRPPSSCCLTPWPWSVIGNQTAKSGPKRPTVVCCCRAFVCSCVSADVCPPRHPGDCSCDPGPRGPVVPRRSQRGLVRLTKVIWRQRHGCCPLCVCVWAENLVLSPALSLCCRMMLVGSREGQWPLIFSMIHIRRQTPLPAVMFQVKWFQYTEHRSRLPCLSKPRFFKLLPLVVVVVLFWHSVLSVFSTPCRFW